MHLSAILPWQILRAIQASSSMGDLGESMGEMSWGKGEFGSDDVYILFVLYIYVISLRNLPRCSHWLIG